MKTEEQLTILWFTPPEIRVYIALLKSGGAYVSQISRDTKIGRVSLYYTLDSLRSKGLIYETTRKNIKFFSPEKPEKIVNIYKERLNIAENILPELKILENADTRKPTFKYYEGIDGVREVLKEIFSQKEIKSYANFIHTMEFDRNLIDSHLRDAIKKRMPFNIILPHNQVVIDYLRSLNTDEAHTLNYVFINESEFPFQYDVFIGERTVGIISTNDQEIIAIKIESRAYADSQRAIFDLAWLGATSFVV